MNKKKEQLKELIREDLFMATATKLQKARNKEEQKALDDIMDDVLELNIFLDDILKNTKSQI